VVRDVQWWYLFRSGKVLDSDLCSKSAPLRNFSSPFSVPPDKDCDSVLFFFIYIIVVVIVFFVVVSVFSLYSLCVVCPLLLVMCVICVLCLIVVSLPLGKILFAVKINNK
jgi:hypothetical protein